MADRTPGPGPGWTDSGADVFVGNLGLRERVALQVGTEAIRPEGRWLNVRPDAPDFRDRPFVPGFVALPPTLGPDPVLNDISVRNQGELPACTGMAFATAVDLTLRRMWVVGGRRDTEPAPVSARMLYEMGRAHDEFEDGLPGSSLRGVMRGFFHNGVAPERPELDAPEHLPGMLPWRFTIDRARDAREVVLGVYARLAHVLLDYQAALAENGGGKVGHGSGGVISLRAAQ